MQIIPTIFWTCAKKKLREFNCQILLFSPFGIPNIVLIHFKVLMIIYFHAKLGQNEDFICIKFVFHFITSSFFLRTAILIPLLIQGLLSCFALGFKIGSFEVSGQTTSFSTYRVRLNSRTRSHYDRGQCLNARDCWNGMVGNRC